MPLLLFLVWAPAAAYGWSWPLQGSVLAPFAYDEAHPYGAGQHRGIDIGADAAGETVVAPASGTVSFAGAVPTSGRSVTIETSDGYAVTLTHLGSILVSQGATVAEGAAVGAVGPSGTPEVDGPYVHLGIRVTTDPNGYVDPLGLLPAATTESAQVEEDTATSEQPSAGGGSSPTPSTEPAPAPVAGTPPASSPVAGAAVANTRGTTIQPRGMRSSSRRGRGRAHGSRPGIRRPRSSGRPVMQVLRAAAVATPSHAARLRRRLSEPPSTSRRPVVEAAARPAPIGLDAGRETGSSTALAQLEQPQARTSGVPLALLCNGAAALVALAAALAAGRRRRPELAGGTAGAQVLDLPRPASDWHRRHAA